MEQHTAPAPESQFHVIALADIRPSKTNPRRSMDTAALAELTASIRTKGVLQPVLVRPNGKGFELVAGHRRLAAAKAAGLQTIPAIARTLSDVEVLEVQIIENLQRADLHPLEEAEGYRVLHAKHGYSAEDLAVKVGKSKAYVYARLKLCALPEASKKAFLEGKLSASVALLVARIPTPALAAQACQWILQRDLSARDAARYIQEHFMTALSGAPWKKDDAELLPEAGPCTTCPKRTGNQAELFGDVKSTDVCTDIACFAMKRQAFAGRRLEQARAAGQTVLTGKKAQEALQGRDFVALTDTCFEIHYNHPLYRKDWRQVLGKDAPEAVLATGSRHYGEDENTLHELVPRAAALKVLGTRHPKAMKPQSTPQRDGERLRRKAHQLRKASGMEVLAALVQKATARKPDLAFWRWLAGAVCGSAGQMAYEVEKRRELASTGKGRLAGRGAPGIHKVIPTLQEPALRALVVELLAADGVPQWAGAGFREPLTTACELYGVSLAAVQARVKKAAAAKTSKA